MKDPRKAYRALPSWAREIVDQVCEARALKPLDVMATHARGGARDVAHARWEVWSLLRQARPGTASASVIARMFQVDPSTVRHGLNNLESLQQERPPLLPAAADPETRRVVADMTTLLADRRRRVRGIRVDPLVLQAWRALVVRLAAAEA